MCRRAARYRYHPRDAPRLHRTDRSQRCRQGLSGTVTIPTASRDAEPTRRPLTIKRLRYGDGTARFTFRARRHSRQGRGAIRQRPRRVSAAMAVCRAPRPMWTRFGLAVTEKAAVHARRQVRRRERHRASRNVTVTGRATPAFPANRTDGDRPAATSRRRVKNIPAT